MTEVLEVRLPQFMNKLISLNQATFLKERLLVYGVVEFNKLVGLAMKDCLIFKIVFQKAYDYINWSFLGYMTYMFGFGNKKRAYMIV